VPRVEVFPERAEQSTGAFHHHDLRVASDLPHISNHVGRLHAFAFPPRGEEGREGGAKIPWIDFLKRHCAIEQPPQNARVLPPAGANWFERHHPQAMIAQTRGEHRGQYRLAHPGVRAGDENDSVPHHARNPSTSRQAKATKRRKDRRTFP